MILETLFWRPCFSIDGEGSAGGGEGESGGEGGAGNEGDKPAVESKKVEVDEKEYTDLKSLKDTIGDNFDAEKWGKLKGFDVEKVVENMEFGTAVEKDALLQAILKERIVAQKAGRKVNLNKILKNFEAELEPETPAGKKKGNEAKPGEERPKGDPRVEELYQEKVQREAKDHQKTFDDTFDKAITESKIKMTAGEKKALKNLVESAYVNEIMKNKSKDFVPDYKDIQKIIKTAFKDIQTYRDEIMSDTFRTLLDSKDESPDGLNGGKPSNIQKTTKTATREERHAAIAADIRSLG